MHREEVHGVPVTRSYGSRDGNFIEAVPDEEDSIRIVQRSMDPENL